LNRRDFYEDSFIIFNGNRNQPRKRIDITMQAFKLFTENKPENVKLYLHMGVVDDHINIVKYANRLGIDNRLVISEPRKGIQTLSERKLNEIYNATEVGVNTSLGEGWGLVNMEHASVGKPQIVGDHSAFKEIYEDCGLLVPYSQELIINNIMTSGKLSKPEDFAERMDWLYTNKELYNTLSEASKIKFARPEYSWKFISGLWDKVYKEVLNR
jgi:D-inositol-3-phosphate glycosyltransferase